MTRPEGYMEPLGIMYRLAGLSLDAGGPLCAPATGADLSKRCLQGGARNGPRLEAACVKQSDI